MSNGYERSERLEHRNRLLLFAPFLGLMLSSSFIRVLLVFPTISIYAPCARVVSRQGLVVTAGQQ